MEAISNKNIYIVVGIISVLIIVSFLINIFINYRKHKDLEEKTIFPPWPSKCPDYWSNNGSNKCINTKKLGKCKTGISTTDSEMSFSDTMFTGSKGHYYKCNWAKQCQVPWEGIDNLC